MKAEALAHERHILAEDAFAEIVIWRVPHAVKGSTHRFKYRLALVVAGAYNIETVYKFNGYEKLLADFWADVEEWRRRR
jgi:hypothetical protein